MRAPTPARNLTLTHFISIALAAASCTAQAQEPSALPKISVESAEENTYLPTEASIGAKGNLAPRDIPQSVTVFNESAIRDLAPQALDELADYVAGVDREGLQANPYALAFYIRGFSAGGSASTYNGFRENGFNTPQAAINIDRIEFLKGPASVLSGGNGALSGLVNIVSKRPLAQSYHRLEATAGSFDHLVAGLDSTGSLNSDRSLRYRLTASVDKDGNFVDQTKQESRFISPYLSWDIGSATRLDLELVNQDIDRPGREGVFLAHPDFFRLPLDIQLGDPGAPGGGGGELTRRLARVDLTHRFANGWQLRQGVFVNNVHSDDTTIQQRAYDPQTHLLTRRLRAVDEYQRERTSQTELSGTSSTGSLQHQWLGGVEYSRQTDGFQFTLAPYSSINIFNPQYPGQQTGPRTVIPRTDREWITKAVYLQDLVTLGGGFKLLVGLRHDSLEATSQNPPGAPKVRQTDKEVTPRVGLLYEPTDQLTWYASWGTSFRPNSGRDVNRGIFDPQTGDQIELGAKYELARGLAVNAAIFQYTFQNVLTSDPANLGFSIATGEQRSRGLELETTGRITNDWSLIASYSYLDAEVTRDNTLPVGDRLPGVPKHSASLFNRLNLAPIGLSQWSVTAGIVYAGTRNPSLPNDPAGALTAADIRLPSYTRVDAGIIFRANSFEARLNGRNLTDERIYDSSGTIEPRAPRSVEVSASVEF